MNNALKIITPSASMSIGLSEDIEKYVNLAIGSPDILPPAEVFSLLHDAINNKNLNYISAKGSKKALANLKNLIFPFDDIKYDTELMLVNGAKYGIYLALKTLCNNSDSVLLMEPYWLSYPSICQSLNLSYVSWKPEIDENGVLHYDLNQLNAILERQKLKVLILNNPNNPSGQVFDAQFINSLNQLLIQHDVYLLIDEVYKDLSFEEYTFRSNSDTKNIVRVGSFSKSLCMPGLRIGYVHAPEEIINGMNLFNQHIMTCINSLSHYVVENVDPKIYQKHIGYCAKVYQGRFNDLRYSLDNSGFLLLESKASFYALIDCKNYFNDGNEATDYLREEYKMLVTPGIHYGEAFKNYIRICLTIPNSQITKSFQSMIKSLKNKA